MNVRLGALIMFFAVVVAAGFAHALTPTEILAKSQALEQDGSRVAEYTMTVLKKNGKEHAYKIMVYEKQTAAGGRKMIRVTEPASQKGLAVLTWERRGAADQQWLLRPGKKKARELDAGDRKDDLLESDVAFEDLGYRTPENSDNQLLQQVLYDARQCYLIESRPNKGVESGYAYWRTWVDVVNFIPAKVEFYDKKGRMVKTIAAKKSEQIDGRWTVTRMETRTDLKSGAKTVFALDHVQYGAEVPDKYLNKDSFGED